MSFSKFLNVLTFVCYGMMIIAAGMVLDQLATGAVAGKVYGAAEISCERISYGLFFLGMVGFHINLMRFLKSQPLKLFLTIFSPVLSIVCVFLANNYLHLLVWNYTPGKIAKPFLFFLKYDLAYTAGFGLFRYIGPFILLLLICTSMYFITGDGWKSGAARKIQ